MGIDNIEVVTMTVDEFNELRDNDFLLKCLQGAGVDNWEGYDYALEMYQEEYAD